MIRLSSRDGARILALAAAYALAAIIGLRLGATLHATPPMWPATGIAVATLCTYGLRLWPGVALGTLAAFAFRSNGPLLTTFIVASTTVEAVVATLLLQRVAGFRSELRRARDACALVIAAGIVAPIVGATIGAAAFALVRGPTNFGHEWLDWFLGDAMGAIVFAPLALAWVRRGGAVDAPSRRWEGTAFAICLAVSATVALGSPLGGDARPLIFITFPFIVWGALRLGLRTTFTAVALVAVAASSAAAMKAGVFAGTSNVGSLLQAYLATAAATALIVTASVAERRDATARLRESERRLSLVHEATTDRIALFAVEGEGISRLTFANSAYLEAAREREPGLVADELVGATTAQIAERLELPPATRVFHRQQLDVVVRTRAPVHLAEYIDIDGTPNDVTLSPVLGDDGAVTHVLWKSQDVADRVRAETALRESEARLSLVFNSSSDTLLLFSVEGKDSYRLVMANRASRDVLRTHCPEHGTREIAGLTMRQFVTDVLGLPSDRVEHNNELFRRVIQSKTPVTYENNDWGRSDLVSEVTLVPVVDQTGRCSHVLRSSRDISERRRAEMTRRTLEAELFHAQKMEAIGTLAGGIAHDFNNILAAIVGNAEVAQSELAPHHPARQDINEVLVASRRARDLVRQILTFSRKQEAVRRPVLLAEVIEDVLRLLRATMPSTLELRKSIADPGAHIFGDPTQLHQVLMNLCTNASHAVGDQHGVIEVGQSTVDVDADSPRTDLAPGRYVCVWVADSGHGMDRATMERVFEPFFTTKAPGVGTGLGLAVVHGIVRNHDGVALVESTPGRGTTFQIYLPAYEPKEAVTQSDSLTRPRGAGQRVLFVDDEPSLTRVARRALEPLGYTVVAYRSATDALDAVRANPTAFDVVVSDLTMPGLTGVQLATELRRVRATLPVILSTGYLDRLDEDAAESLHVHELLIKPYTTDALATAIHRALRAS